MEVLCVQNWKTQRPARNEVAHMFGEAAALPCVLEEQVQIAHLLTAYDRWLVRSCATCCISSYNYDLLGLLTAGHSFGLASVFGPNQWQVSCANHTVVWEQSLCLEYGQAMVAGHTVCSIASAIMLCCYLNARTCLLQRHRFTSNT